MVAPTDAQPSKRAAGRRGNGEGSIYKRASDGLWVGAITLPNGTRRTFASKDRATCQRTMQNAAFNARTGIPIPKGSQSLSAFLETWLRDVVQPGTRPNTFACYRQVAHNHLIPNLGRSKLTDLTGQQIATLLRHKRDSGLSPRMVQLIHAVLRMALRQAMDWNLVGHNAATSVKPPTVTHWQVAAMSRNQANAILAAFAGHRLEGVVTVALGLGLRRGEVLGLRWSDIDLEARTVTVQGQWQRVVGGWQFVPLKTARSRRMLSLPVFIVAALKQQRVRQLERQLEAGGSWTDHDLVFPAATGGPWDGTNVDHLFRQRLIAQGLPLIRFHDLRHGAATLQLAAGSTMREIMEMLGHSQISLTANTYTHIGEEMKRAAADRMDAVFGT